MCLVLESLGGWLCIFGPMSTELTQFCTHSLGFPLVHTLRWNNRGMCIERTIILIYDIYKFIDYEQNIYMNVT